MSDPILRLQGLIKRYGSKTPRQNGQSQGNQFTLDIPDLEFQSGKTYGLVGPNGAGKTTLLNVLSLLEKPDRGRIFFKGQEIADSASILRARREMSMVMENPLLFRTTVSKNLASGLRFRSVDRNSWRQLSEEALRQVRLEGFGQRHAPELSRGQAQRVAIARALVLKPKILFLDEPFTNIDKENVHVVEELIETSNGHATTIFTTHDFAQAYKLSDEVISLLNGKLVKGSIENLLSGEIEEAPDDSHYVQVSPSVRLAVVTKKRGSVHVSIAPEDIIISHEKLQSSARNSFKGTVKEIQMEGQIVRVCVNVGVELVAVITPMSYDRMNLSVGSSVFVTFKSSSITVF